MGQFLNSEQTSLSCLNAGRNANSVTHRWLFKGDASLILTFGGDTLASCDVGGGQACICREGVSGCISHIYVGLFTCTVCAFTGQATEEGSGAV